MKKFDMGLLTPTTFKETIPSSGEEIELRPFIVAEYKALMIAKEGGSESEAINNVLDNCVVTEGVSIYDLPMYDAEYLFVRLFSSSTGNRYVPVAFLCKNKTEADAPECDTRIEYRIDMDEAWVPLGEGFEKTKVFPVNDVVALELSHPTMRMTNENDFKTTEGAFKVMVSCITKVIANEQVYTPDELGDAQMAEIFEHCPGSLLDKLVSFTQKIPRVTSIGEIECPGCGYKHSVQFKGIDDFFV